MCWCCLCPMICSVRSGHAAAFWSPPLTLDFPGVLCRWQALLPSQTILGCSWSMSPNLFLTLEISLDDCCHLLFSHLFFPADQICHNRVMCCHQFVFTMHCMSAKTATGLLTFCMLQLRMILVCHQAWHPTFMLPFHCWSMSLCQRSLFCHLRHHGF